MNQQDEARDELVAELRTANLTTHMFINADGSADARRATDSEAAELAADWVMGMFDHLAGVLGYSRPQVVETIEELDALPVGSRIFTPKTGNVWWPNERSRGWSGSCGGYSYASDLLEHEGPATVLHMPEEAR